MSFEKLVLEFEDKTKVTAHFNPENVSIKRDANWKPKPSTGKDAPPAQVYVAGGAATMTLDLLFDTTHLGTAVTTVTSDLDKLVELYKGAKGYDSGNDTGRPQWVKVKWGKLPVYPWIASSLSVDYTYFDQRGKPLRAKVQTSLTQFTDPNAKKPTNPTSGTPRPHKLHTVSAGETLDRIASLHYGNPSKWRMLAEANMNIFDDPMNLRAGTVLIIPDRRGRASG